MGEKLLHYGPTKEAWTQKYDTVAGITLLIETLDGFHELIQERRNAALDNEHPLGLCDFVLLGTWRLDARGNTMEFGYHLTPYMLHHAPRVIGKDDFYAWAFAYGIDFDVVHHPSKDKTGHSFTRGLVPDMDKLPRSHQRCAECKNVLSIENLEDLVTDHPYPSSNPLDGSKYIGMTLQEVEDIFSSSIDDTHRTLKPGPSIRHDRFVDLTIDPTHGYVCNKEGWASEREGIDMSYLVQEGDDLGVWVNTYRHSLCHLYWQTRKEEKFFRELLTEAGVEIKTMVPIPRNYDPPSLNLAVHTKPWFMLNGMVRIGHLYHRWEVNWGATGKDLSYLFKDEDVDKEPMLIQTREDYHVAKKKLAGYVRTVLDALAVVPEKI